MQAVIVLFKCGICVGFNVVQVPMCRVSIQLALPAASMQHCVSVGGLPKALVYSVHCHARCGLVWRQATIQLALRTFSVAVHALAAVIWRPFERAVQLFTTLSAAAASSVLYVELPKAAFVLPEDVLEGSCSFRGLATRRHLICAELCCPPTLTHLLVLLLPRPPCAQLAWLVAFAQVSACVRAVVVVVTGLHMQSALTWVAAWADCGSGHVP